MHLARHLLLPSLLLVLGCGSSHATGDLAGASSLDRAAADVTRAVASYRNGATAATSPADCTAALQRYQGELRGPMDSLRQLAPMMDGYLSSSGVAGAADVTCASQAMRDEMARHLAAACGGADAAADRAEALRHCDAMASLAAHEQMRAVQAGGMMMGAGAGGGSGGGTMGGGTMGGGMMDGGMMGADDLSWMGGWRQDGRMMPDGTVMSFTHAVPGCAAPAGG